MTCGPGAAGGPPCWGRREPSSAARHLGHQPPGQPGPGGRCCTARPDTGWAGTWALIRYRGRHTGRSYELPVQYARDGGHIWILPGAPEHKTWWRNLRDGAAVDLGPAGHEHHGHATVIGPGQPGFAKGLAAYLRAHPTVRRALGLP